MKCTAVLNIFLLLFSLLSNAVEEEIKNNSDEQAVQPVAEPVSEEIKAEEVKNNLDEQAVQPVAEPVSEEIKAEEPAAVKELTETEKDMQAIEPGFVPKDDRVTEIFLLNKQINQNELEIKNKEDEKIKIRNSFINYFQEKLREYSSKFLSNKEEKYYSSLKEKVEFLEKALDYNNKNSKFRANDYYDYANDSFKLSEYEFSKNFALYSQAKEQGKEDVPYPDEDFSRSIKAYKYIIKNYPKFKHIEDVYYMYSISLWFEGDFYKAVKYFKYIIQKFKKGVFAQEILFRLGEYFYDMDEYDNAIESYSKINKKSSFYDKALYKIAWSHYQKDEYDLAIKNFSLLMRLLSSKDMVGKDNSMKEEVIRYIVKSFSEKQNINKPPKAKIDNLPKEQENKKPVATEAQEEEGVDLVNAIYGYFTQGKKPIFLRDIMLEAAKQLFEESRLIGTVKAFEYALRLSPKHPDNPRIESQIVDIFQESGKMDDARKKNIQIIRKYGAKSRWIKSQKPFSPGVRFAKDAVRDAMLWLAVYYHKLGKEFAARDDEGSKKLSQLNFKKAADLYLRYIKEYPEKEDDYKAIFYFAESSYEIKKFKTALEAYRLLKDYPLPIPGTFRADAVFNIVFTYKNVIDQAIKKNKFKNIDFDNVTSKIAGKEKEEIPSIGIDYINSIEEFLQVVPYDERASVLYFHAASIYYVYGHLDEAFARFFVIIDKYPQSTAALVAARLLIDDAVSKEDWNKVLELAKKFKENNLGGQSLDFARIEGNARFKIAKKVFEEAESLFKEEKINDAKDKFKESAKLYIDLLQDDPKNPYADIMIFNTAQAIVRSGSSADALPYYKKLYKEYPQSQYASSARFQEAFLLEKMLKFSEAATAYDGIIKQDPTSDAAADAMLNKALLYEAAGDLTKASLAYIEFANKYPQKEEASVALLTASSLYKEMNQVEKQIAMLEQFVKKYKTVETKSSEVIEAMVLLADTYDALSKKTSNLSIKNQYEKSRNTYYKLVVEKYEPQKDSPVAGFYTAKAHLYLEKPEQDSFKKLSIDNPKVRRQNSAQQAKNLTDMMKRLQELSQKNESIIKRYAQPVWNAESLYRIGNLYAHLASSISNASCPYDIASFDEYACDEYSGLLIEKAEVLEEKAFDAYKQAYDIALSAYDAPSDMLDKILLALSKIKPGQYQKLGDVIFDEHVYSLPSVGRMLSNRKMSSILHSKEKDPDISTKEEIEENLEKTQEKSSEEEQDKEEESLEEEDENEDENEDDEEEEDDDEDL